MASTPGTERIQEDTFPEFSYMAPVDRRLVSPGLLDAGAPFVGWGDMPQVEAVKR